MSQRTFFDLPDADGIVHRIQADAVRELVRDGELSRSKLRAVEAVMYSAATKTRGERWSVRLGWAAATRGGLPDQASQTRVIAELTSPEWRGMWRSLESRVRDALEVPAPWVVELLGYRDTEGGPEFRLAISGTDVTGLRGRVAGWWGAKDGLLSDEVLELERMARELADGKQRAQTELRLEQS